uniref:Uncharacterized protein n=1 Tax=Timema douglasi TaxID=61478 RepID=A0A7R8VIN1_TIMDO|nr:unnamed protein product [Timema douglasi]
MRVARLDIETQMLERGEGGAEKQNVQYFEPGGSTTTPDTKNSVGLAGCIEEVSHNAIAVYWNPLESSAKVRIFTAR